MTQSKTELSACLTKYEANLSSPNIESVDIANKSKSRLHLAVGDAHGNWFKLIHNAISFGTVTSSDPNFFQKIRLLYDALNQHPLDMAQFTNYLSLLKTCSVKPGITDIFLGDIRCDRGQNDILTLAWLAHLDEQKSTFRIIFSNHDFEGLRPKEDFYKDFNNMDAYNQLFHVSRFKMEQFLESYSSDIRLINFHKHYEAVYKNHLVLIDYTVTEAGRVMLYTHAGCGMETIEALAQKYGVSYEESTIETLIKTINEINIKFKDDLSHNLDWNLLYKHSPNKPQESDTLFNVIATRQLRPDFRDQPHNKAYIVQHVHGHNGRMPYTRTKHAYFAAFPFSQNCPQSIERDIARKDAILIAMNTEEESSRFYLMAVNERGEYIVIDFLRKIELLPSENALQAELTVLQEASKEALRDLEACLKQIPYTGKVRSLNLNEILNRIPFIKQYVNLFGISLDGEPSSFINLDCDLGKIHSYVLEGVENKWFENSYPMKVLSCAPHLTYHPEETVQQNTKHKRSLSPNRFFEQNNENSNPNSPVLDKKMKSSSPHP